MNRTDGESRGSGWAFVGHAVVAHPPPPAPGDGSAVAALATLASCFRLPSDAKRLRFALGPDPTNLVHLIRAAQSLRLSVEPATRTWDSLGHARFPLLARFRNGDGSPSFVVVAGVRPDAAILVGPGVSPFRIDRDEFCRRWTGWVLQASPRGPSFDSLPPRF